MLEGQKILITGATGKISFPIARTLARRNEVWGAARLSKPGKREFVQVLRLLEVLVNGPDLAKRVAAETGNAPITLALDGVSDTTPMHLMNCLSERGVLMVLWWHEPQADGRAPGQLHFQEADDTWLLASLLVSVSQAG